MEHALQRIVRQRSEVDDGVETGEVRGGDVAQVDVERRHNVGRRGKVTLVVEARIEAGDFVTCVLQCTNQRLAEMSRTAREALKRRRALAEEKRSPWHR